MARIVRIHEYGDASVLRIEDLAVAAPASDEVQINVKAIGINRAEAAEAPPAKRDHVRNAAPARGWAARKIP